MVFSSIVIISKHNTEYINETEYPTKACDYIISELDYKNIRIYNEYNYGSYLMYRGIPVFIDSRSDLYLEEFNKGVTIFKDAMDQEVNYEDTFEKYNVTHILINNLSYLNQTLKVNSKYNVLYSDEYFTLYEITGKNLVIELNDLE